MTKLRFREKRRSSEWSMCTYLIYTWVYVMHLWAAAVFCNFIAEQIGFYNMFSAIGASAEVVTPPVRLPWSAYCALR